MLFEAIFSICTGITMIGWFILVFAPRRRNWVNTIPKVAVPLALSVVYAGFIVAFFPDADGGYGSLAQVRQLFSKDELLLAGWIHYLAFDLMVGSFLADQMDKMRINRFIQGPILLLTLMFGPIGLLVVYSMKGGLRFLSTETANDR